MVKRWAWILGVVLLAGCASGRAKAVATTTTTSLHNITLHVVAEQALTCAQSPVHELESAVVTDQHGTTIGTAPFVLTPGAASCDFTATITVPSATYYAFSTDKGAKIGTVSRADLASEDWTANFTVDLSGDIVATTS